MKNKLLALVFICCVFFLGCKSIPNSKQDFMYSMVYDFENQGVKDVAFILDGKEIGKSDVYGRFLIPISRDRKIFHLDIKKEGYEILSDEIQFVPDLVLYYKIGNAKQYFFLAENFLDENKLDESEAAINKAISIEERDDFFLLKEIILAKKAMRIEK